MDRDSDRSKSFTDCEYDLCLGMDTALTGCTLWYPGSLAAGLVAREFQQNSTGNLSDPPAQNLNIP